MRRTALTLVTAAAALLPLGSAAHVSPPLRLLSDREALQAALPDARSFAPLKLKLSPEQSRLLRTRWSWRPAHGAYRVYEGRDEGGRTVGTAYFLTEATLHGPVRMAVGVDGGGRVRGAAVAEVSEEAYGWVRPLVERDLPRDYLGLDSRATFGVSERVRAGGLKPMQAFYARTLATLMQRGAALFEVGLKPAASP